MEYGKFCEVYGKNLRNVVLEHVLTFSDMDFAISDLFDLRISKPKLYQIVKELVSEDIIEKSRSVAGTQLFILADNEKTRLLKNSFRECLKAVIDEHKIKVKN